MQLLIRVIRPIIHATIITAIFYGAYHLRLQTDLIPGIQLRIPVIYFSETMIFALLAALIFVTIGFLKNRYELYKPRHSYGTIAGKTWVYWTITITFLAYFWQGFIFIAGISRIIIIISSLITLIAIALFDRLRNMLDDRFFTRTQSKILIIAHTIQEGKKALPFLHKYYTKQYDIITPDKRKANNTIDYHTTIAVGNFERKFLQSVFEAHRLNTSRLFHLAEGFLLQDVVYKAENIGNTVALEYTHSTLDGRSKIIKRLFDIIISLLAIIILSPIFLLIAILISLDSPGPILYIQDRVGKYGRHFSFIKFRTMYTHLSIGSKYWGNKAQELYQQLINSDQNHRKGVLAKIHNDPRVTKIGKRLRKTSLDELPNFFSVLIGTMSIVGPRPHLPNEIAKYKSRQKRLLSIKPGITGYAQVFGRDALSFDEEAKLDLYYIQNRSLRLDIYVLFMTIKVVGKGQ
jgi:exopolysaccharide biosynthesis polyprenyl glycosylphosphotransferase